MSMHFIIGLVYGIVLGLLFRALWGIYTNMRLHKHDEEILKQLRSRSGGDILHGHK